MFGGLPSFSQHSRFNRSNREFFGVQALGTNLMVELHECSSEMLDDVIKVEEVMVAAAEAAGATVVQAHFHEFTPIGVSGFVVITESHLAIHTWPEHHYAAVDIFTCGNEVKPERAAQELIDKFQCKNPTMFEVKRGFASPPSDNVISSK